MKSQVSFEFIILFALVFFVFILIVGFIGNVFKNSEPAKESAQGLAKEIKSKIITASLSQADFQTKLILPSSLGKIPITVEFHKDPDNIMRILNVNTNEVIYTAHLPVIDDVTNSNDRTIMITKQSASLTIDRT